MQKLIEILTEKQADILTWLDSTEAAVELPLYSSVDIRDGGFKTAVVDMNLFPAGFNNLCEHGVEDAVAAMRRAVTDRVPGCRDILVIAEEHTRNTWYLENIHALQEIIRQSGFEPVLATFLEIQPAFCECVKFVELETATGKSVRMHCMLQLLKEFREGRRRIDLIIMNNDLTQGIPEALRTAGIPIYPSMQMGWHARHKSHYFCHATQLIGEFALKVGVDPWLLDCLHSSVENVDINVPEHRKLMQDAASDLMARIRAKYAEHGVAEKPFFFVKADSGTYGMGVKAFEDASELGELGRRARNALYKGKGSKVITRYLLQEGVPTISKYEDQVAEACLYQIANTVVGGFYRLHGEKGSRESLNARGMSFKAICPHLSKYGQCGIHTDINIFDVYRVLARMAGIAAHRETVDMEKTAAV